MYEISNEAWKKVYSYLRSCKNIYTNNEDKTRLFFNAIVHIDRTGCQWRALPQSFGEWSATYHRFADWSRKGIWEQLFTALSEDQDLEYVMIDSTIMRAHACAAGAPKKTAVTITKR